MSAYVLQTQQQLMADSSRSVALNLREPLPGADGQDLQQARGRHLEGGAELGHARLLQQLERLTQHGLRPAELGQNVEQTAGDGQRDVHRLVANAQREHGH